MSIVCFSTEGISFRQYKYAAPIPPEKGQNCKFVEGLDTNFCINYCIHCTYKLYGIISVTLCTVCSYTNYSISFWLLNKIYSALVIDENHVFAAENIIIP